MVCLNTHHVRRALYIPKLLIPDVVNYLDDAESTKRSGEVVQVVVYDASTNKVVVQEEEIGEKKKTPVFCIRSSTPADNTSKIMQVLMREAPLRSRGNTYLKQTPLKPRPLYVPSYAHINLTGIPVYHSPNRSTDEPTLPQEPVTSQSSPHGNNIPPSSESTIRTPPAPVSTPSRRMFTPSRRMSTPQAPPGYTVPPDTNWQGMCGEQSEAVKAQHLLHQITFNAGSHPQPWGVPQRNLPTPQITLSRSKQRRQCRRSRRVGILSSRWKPQPIRPKPTPVPTPSSHNNEELDTLGMNLGTRIKLGPWSP